jgi:hypothetical protein
MQGYISLEAAGARETLVVLARCPHRLPIASHDGGVAIRGTFFGLRGSQRLVVLVA